METTFKQAAEDFIHAAEDTDSIRLCIEYDSGDEEAVAAADRFEEAYTRLYDLVHTSQESAQ